MNSPKINTSLTVGKPKIPVYELQSNVKSLKRAPVIISKLLIAVINVNANSGGIL